MIIELFGYVLDNLTGWQKTLGSKPIYKPNYDLFAVIIRGLDRFSAQINIGAEHCTPYTNDLGLGDRPHGSTAMAMILGFFPLTTRSKRTFNSSVVC